MTESQASPESVPAVDAVLNDPEFQELTRRKAALSSLLLALTVACYFAFVLMLAFGVPLLATAAGNATLGIPLGVSLIILGWIVTGVYVRWANESYDSAVARLRERHFPGSSDV